MVRFKGKPRPRRFLTWSAASSLAFERAADGSSWRWRVKREPDEDGHLWVVYPSVRPSRHLEVRARRHLEVRARLGLAAATVTHPPD